VVVGYLQHVAVARFLDHDGDASRPRWPLTITAAAFGGALVLSGLILVST
jgi:hypothetical protein